MLPIVTGRWQPWVDFDAIIAIRRRETDEFYDQLQPHVLTNDDRLIQRQAFAGMIWSKKFYHWGVDMWLRGDPAYPSPPSHRGNNGNAEWRHFYADAVVSLPAPWEYPWPACWDLCLHTPALCLFDPEWTKRQLLLFTREWMMHPNGCLPAYEYNLGDTNPPVHAYASLRVY